MGRARDDKPFDRACWAENDDKAKRVCVGFLQQAGFTDIQENFKESNGDFTEIFDIGGMNPNGSFWKIDCEIKKDWGTKWTGKPYRWPSMDIPFRKRKATCTHHMIVSGDERFLFLVSRSLVESSPVNFKKCWNQSVPSRFYNVMLPAPVEQATFFELRNGKWHVDRAMMPKELCRAAS